MRRRNCEKYGIWHSGPDARYVLTEQGLNVLAHIRLRESWSEAAVAVEGASSHKAGELSGERQPYSKVQDG